MTASPPFPKRILMTADTIGGVWTYAIELARALSEYDIEIALATMGASVSRSQRAEVGSIPNAELFESTYKLEWMNKPWDDINAASEWLMQLEEKVRPDIVHLNGFCHGALPWRVPKVVVGHSCVLSWWRAAKGCNAPREWDTYRKAVTEGLALADLVIAPSKAMLSALNELYGPFASSAVIPNGRRLEASRPRAKHDFILAGGRLWDEAKNISALAEIAPQLPWPVYLSGEDCHPDGRDARHSHVHHLGNLCPRELQMWFERAAIFAAPARYEPFGLSILEAALSGCALALGDIPSLRENWHDAALFVPSDDPAALAAALGELIENTALRADLSQRARRVAAGFTPEKMAREYLTAYSRAARARGQTAPIEQIPTVTSAIDTAEVPALLPKGVTCAS